MTEFKYPYFFGDRVTTDDEANKGFDAFHFSNPPVSSEFCLESMPVPS